MPPGSAGLQAEPRSAEIGGLKGLKNARQMLVLVAV